jgi:hypothetical protein
MSVDKVNENRETRLDITWDKLIYDSEVEIESCKDKISKLRKSIEFFKKQESMGIPFPRLSNKT